MRDHLDRFLERAVPSLLLVGACLLVAAALTGCTSTQPIPECPPCPPGPTIHAPLPAPRDPIPTPPPRPTHKCDSLYPPDFEALPREQREEITVAAVKCLADWWQETRAWIQIGLDEITAANTQ